MALSDGIRRAIARIADRGIKLGNMNDVEVVFEGQPDRQLAGRCQADEVTGTKAGGFCTSSLPQRLVTTRCRTHCAGAAAGRSACRGHCGARYLPGNAGSGPRHPAPAPPQGAVLLTLSCHWAICGRSPASKAPSSGGVSGNTGSAGSACSTAATPQIPQPVAPVSRRLCWARAARGTVGDGDVQHHPLLGRRNLDVVDLVVVPDDPRQTESRWQSHRDRPGSPSSPHG